MKRGYTISAFLIGICAILVLNPLKVQAEIASENAFEGAIWEKIIETDIGSSSGTVQSICATENYIICMENAAEDASTPDVIKAYYRNDTDEDGNPVEQYSLAKQVSDTCYEHCNGMAYNPNTGEIAVALYTNYIGENRGCIYLMDAETLAYKSKVKISDDYNILGIDYDEENDRYVIQTDAEGGYSFKILDSQFQIVEDLGNYDGTAKGSNFQDLCVSGDYIINCPLTIDLGIGDYINMYSISEKRLVSDAQMNFNFENVAVDEPEGICELEPGVFVVAVTVVYSDGRRTGCVYKTMVPYDFSADELSTQKAPEEQAVEEQTAENPNAGTQEKAVEDIDTEEKKTQENVQTNGNKVFIVVVLFAFGGVSLILYMRVLQVRRERKRRLERARRERQRIRRETEEIT